MRKAKIIYWLQRRLKNVKLFFFLTVCSLVFFIGFKYLSNSHFLDVKGFTYNGVVKFVNTPDFENLVSEFIKNKTIFTLESEALENALKANFSAVKKAKVIKKNLNNIEIQIQERVPVAVAIDSSADKYIIDEEGYVLGVLEEIYFDLPTINYEYKLHVGQFIEKQLVPLTLEILNEAKLEDIKISSVSFKPDYSKFYASNTLVFINNSKSIKESIKIVSKLIADAVIEGKRIAKIDLRYDKVIVSYE